MRSSSRRLVVLTALLGLLGGCSSEEDFKPANLNQAPAENATPKINPKDVNKRSNQAGSAGQAPAI